MSGRRQEPSDRERAAQQYAAAGWPVFPLIPGGKVPVTPHGFKDASTDPGRIASWWQRNPDRNIGVATGAPGPDVLDIDDRGERGNGFAAFNRIKREGLVPRPIAIVSTPSGRGFHLWFSGTEQDCGHLAADHLDFKSQGGYVVAPPSTVNGRPYAVVSHQPSNDKLDWPAVRHCLQPQPQPPARRPERERPGDISRLAGWIATRQAGDRNFPLFYAAKQAELGGLLDAEGMERLVDAARRSGLRGGEREARRTIESGRRDAQRTTARRPAREPGQMRPFADREAGA